MGEADVESGSAQGNFITETNLVKVYDQGHSVSMFLGQRVPGLERGGQELLPERPDDPSQMPGMICWLNPATRCSNYGSGGGWRSTPTGEKFMSAQLNTLIPRGPDSFEMWAVQLVRRAPPRS